MSSRARKAQELRECVGLNKEAFILNILPIASVIYAEPFRAYDVVIHGAPGIASSKIAHISEVIAVPAIRPALVLAWNRSKSLSLEYFQ
mmetsp:Transcript_1388/g.1861  ORF Transcript_1388/g.1861 Transcript_1388/m.1861 type:complete len:89 (-) Transcript_1388:1956-2222(-)